MHALHVNVAVTDVSYAYPPVVAQAVQAVVEQVAHPALHAFKIFL